MKQRSCDGKRACLLEPGRDDLHLIDTIKQALTRQQAGSRSVDEGMTTTDSNDSDRLSFGADCCRQGPREAVQGGLAFWRSGDGQRRGSRWCVVLALAVVSRWYRPQPISFERVALILPRTRAFLAAEEPIRFPTRDGEGQWLEPAQTLESFDFFDAKRYFGLCLLLQQCTVTCKAGRKFPCVPRAGEAKTTLRRVAHNYHAPPTWPHARGREAVSLMNEPLLKRVIFVVSVFSL